MSDDAINKLGWFFIGFAGSLLGLTFVGAAPLSFSLSAIITSAVVLFLSAEAI